MNTNDFLNLLDGNSESDLIFEYEKGKFVPVSYHITEVKNIHIESVDCGGRPDSYDETIVQLWVDPSEEIRKPMTASKALKIFDIVNSKKPMNQETPIFFEWGLGDLKTSVYKVESVEQSANQLTVKMFVPATVCKPKFELELSSKSSCGPGCC